MSKILLLGDVHLSDRPPSTRNEDYTEELFDLLYQTAEMCQQDSSITAVVQAGDLFHSKVPGRTSHKMIQRAMEWLEMYPCPVYIVPGNHDMANDRPESVWATQPLGVILRSGVAEVLHGWSPNLDLPLYGVPWLSTWNDRDPETDYPSKRALLDVTRSLESWTERYDGSVPALVVTHAPFYIPSMELPYEFFPVGTFANAMHNHGSVYYGHVHEAHGQFVANGVRFCNHGALSRGSLHEYNLTREISVTTWELSTGEFVKVPLNARPATEIFKIQESRESKALQVSLDEFLTSIGQTSIEITSIESVIAHVRTLGLGTEVETVVEELLQGAVNVR